jgi:hypothetical protein
MGKTTCTSGLKNPIKISDKRAKINYFLKKSIGNFRAILPG